MRAPLRVPLRAPLRVLLLHMLLLLLPCYICYCSCYLVAHKKTHPQLRSPPPNTSSLESTIVTYAPVTYALRVLLLHMLLLLLPCCTQKDPLQTLAPATFALCEKIHKSRCGLYKVIGQPKG